MKSFLKNLFRKKEAEPLPYQMDIGSEIIQFEGLSFDTFGWQLHTNEAKHKMWVCPNFPAIVAFYAIDGKPDIPAPENEDLIRFYFRQRMQETTKGGLIQCNIIEMANMPVIENFIKIPKSPSGVIYIHTLNFLYENKSYIIMLQAEEMGTTGIREASNSPYGNNDV